MPYSDKNPTLGEQIDQHMESKAIGEEISKAWDEGYAEGKRDVAIGLVALADQIKLLHEALELGATWGLASKGYDATTAIALADWINGSFQGDPPKCLLPSSVIAPGAERMGF